MAAAQRIAADAEAGRERVLAAGRADVIRLVGAAEGDAEAARLVAYRDLDPAILLALALRDVAGHLPDIGTLHCRRIWSPRRWPH